MTVLLDEDFSFQVKSAVDASLEFIENDRLKELTLLQTFDVRQLNENVKDLFLLQIVETELENVHDYEHFNDCLDTFPL